MDSGSEAGMTHMNFWQKLNKPFFCLAPMEDVTDFAFREIVAKYGKQELGIRNPSSAEASADKKELGKTDLVIFTEFVCVDALLHPEGLKKFKHNLKFTKAQRPIVAQVWGTDPKKFFQAAKIIKSLKFDGMDINMGCPKQREIKLKACAHLIREPKLAQDIILQAKKGAGPPAGGMPVSIKTRIGYSKIETEKWIGTLLETKPAAITVHGRTKQEMSKVPAHWDEIAKAVELRNKMFPLTPHPSPSPGGRGKNEGLRPLIIGNGDIANYQDGVNRASHTGVDGIMIGRAAIGNPWVFTGSGDISIDKKLDALLEHLKIFEKFQKNKKPFIELRKFIKGYINGFAGASDLRAELMQAQSIREINGIIRDYAFKHANI